MFAGWQKFERKKVSITFFPLAGNLRRLPSLVPIEPIFEKIKSQKSLIFNISTRIYSFASHLNIYRKKFAGCPSKFAWVSPTDFFEISYYGMHV